MRGLFALYSGARILRSEIQSADSPEEATAPEYGGSARKISFYDIKSELRQESRSSSETRTAKSGASADKFPARDVKSSKARKGTRTFERLKVFSYSVLTGLEMLARTVRHRTVAPQTKANPAKRPGS